MSVEFCFRFYAFYPNNRAIITKNDKEIAMDKIFRKRKKEDVMKKPMEIIALKNEACDPNGSYTGICKNPDEKPVQDADDL